MASRDHAAKFVAQRQAPHSMKAPEERRAEIIRAARELYEEQGLAHTSILDITTRVGVTRTLFYHYFPDKDAVTSAVLDDYIGARERRAVPGVRQPRSRPHGRLHHRHHGARLCRAPRGSDRPPVRDVLRAHPRCDRVSAHAPRR